ncbi:hypothetical protein H6G51_02025 [Limnothrix sp. FACHB-708]|uniref:hypothetical protein n=1 Tax=unclassified Limnothrix TaxID=2632864 RepID=UPI0013040395|nr:MULTISPECIES: hypothetical protein [unclassified Limnothrix]MBD2552047.1 hypothetical protein [Limnothrix sp. FACHB-708]MBD2589727.1 hypothetical protein [Limnothrix sp. FACHB-406]
MVAGDRSTRWSGHQKRPATSPTGWIQGEPLLGAEDAGFELGGTGGALVAKNAD